MFDDPFNDQALCPPESLKRLKGPWKLVEETPSTNDLLKSLASQGAPEGTLVVAHSQTRGRGRLGRSWVSPPGLGLYFSILLRPPLPGPQLAPLTLLAGLAAVEALESLGAGVPALKWPNDLLLKGKKLGGVLCEYLADAPKPAFILGMGINLNHETAHFPDELQSRAASLFQLTGRRWARREVMPALVESLDREYDRFLAQGPGPMLARWSDRADLSGKRVVLHRGPVKTPGIARGLDEQGRLLLETDSGLEAFDGGEVSLENP